MSPVVVIELPQLGLVDALELTILVARKDPRPHQRVSPRSRSIARRALSGSSTFGQPTNCRLIDQRLCVLVGLSRGVSTWLRLVSTALVEFRECLLVGLKEAMMAAEQPSRSYSCVSFSLRRVADDCCLLTRGDHRSFLGTGARRCVRRRRQTPQRREHHGQTDEADLVGRHRGGFDGFCWIERCPR